MTPAKKQQEVVRLQVPVTPQLADEITNLGSMLHMTQRKMAGLILDETVSHRQNIFEDLGRYLTAGVSEVMRMITGKGRRANPDKAEVIHLDIQVNAETAEFLTALGEKLGHPPGRMAGQMLRWGVMENDWAIRLVAAPLLKTIKVIRSAKATPKKPKPSSE